MFRILLPVLVLAASTGEAQKGKGGAQNPQGTAATWAQCEHPGPCSARAVLPGLSGADDGPR